MLINELCMDLSGSIGLPNPVREKLLQDGRGEVALMLDFCFMAGLKAGATFSVLDVVALAKQKRVGVSEGLIRRALSDELFILYGKVGVGRGRPVTMYQMRSIQEIAGLVSGGWLGTTDVIAIEACGSLASYRRALHVAFIERCPGKYSREWLGKRLGVGSRATWFYEQGSRVYAVAQYARRMLFDWSDVPVRAVRGRRFLEVVRNFGTHAAEIVSMPLCQFLVRREMRAGHKCFEVVRESNYYSVWRE